MRPLDEDFVKLFWLEFLGIDHSLSIDEYTLLLLPLAEIAMCCFADVYWYAYLLCVSNVQELQQPVSDVHCGYQRPESARPQFHWSSSP